MTNTTPYHELAADFARKRLTRLTDKQGWLLHAAARRQFGEAGMKALVTKDGTRVPLPDGRSFLINRLSDGYWHFEIEATASLF
jgi:hypothetical protein